MYFNHSANISTLNSGSLKLADKFSYLRSYIPSTENDMNTRLAKAWTAIKRRSIIWKSDLSDKIKRNFFQTAVVSILLKRCNTWTLPKCIEKKLVDDCTRMLIAILNKSWKQHPAKQQLYSHQPPILKTIQIRRTRHVGFCLRSKYKLISELLKWAPSHGRKSVARPARTYLQHLCTGHGT